MTTTERRRDPLAFRGCCRDHRQHGTHLMGAVLQAAELIRLIPLAGDQDGYDHKLAAQLAMADLRRLVTGWVA